MKKVLYVITKSNWGGAQRYVFDMATAAKAAGLEPVVVYGGAGELATKLYSTGIRGIEVPGLGRNVSVADVGVYRSLRALFEEERPDVVHLNSSKIGILGAIAARVSAVPRIIFTAHGWAFNEPRPLWQRGAIWCAHYLSVLLCDVTIAVSQAVVRDARTMPFVGRKITLIYNGLAQPEFLSQTDARVALAGKLAPGTALSPTSMWLGTIAELNWNKGLHHLIRAAGLLARRGYDFVLAIMGEGQERGFLETLIQEEKLENRVLLLGHVENAARYLKALDIFVLPSHTEALSYALIEAGYAGLPATATHVGGIPEILENEVSGLLVARDDPRALEGGLERLLRDATLRARLGQALQKTVREKFNLSRMHEQTLALY
ncbi:MAG: glycosyltransferase [Patescibacteria group bacterium]|nr:glycosyltransferase [Patescibacteria group bacterium]